MFRIWLKIFNSWIFVSFQREILPTVDHTRRKCLSFFSLLIYDWEVLLTVLGSSFSPLGTSCPSSFRLVVVWTLVTPRSSSRIVSLSHSLILEEVVLGNVNTLTFLEGLLGVRRCDYVFWRTQKKVSPWWILVSLGVSRTYGLVGSWSTVLRFAPVSVRWPPRQSDRVRKKGLLIDEPKVVPLEVVWTYDVYPCRNTRGPWEGLTSGTLGVAGGERGRSDSMDRTRRSRLQGRDEIEATVPVTTQVSLWWIWRLVHWGKGMTGIGPSRTVQLEGHVTGTGTDLGHRPVWRHKEVLYGLTV